MTRWKTRHRRKRAILTAFYAPGFRIRNYPVKLAQWERHRLTYNKLIKNWDHDLATQEARHDLYPDWNNRDKIGIKVVQL